MTVLTRRTFIKTGVAGFGSILLLPSCLKPSGPCRFFTPGEAACLIAICEQIIPADKYGGGATEAGVIHYIDKQLTVIFHADQARYQEGLDAVQHSCLELYGQRFEMLDPGTQESFLRKMEADELPGTFWTSMTPSGFFNLVIDHTMQGFYGAPRHGGNKNYMSYRMMGLDYPLVVGRNHYNHSI
jgi:gluconate 2-dehydrogenase gamma chain